MKFIMSRETEKKNDSPLVGAVTQIFPTSGSDGLDGASMEHQTGAFIEGETERGRERERETE